MNGRLYVVAGPEKGQSFELPASHGTGSGAGILLGRSSRAQVRLSDPEISIEHALITQREESYYLENLSAHGTLVNETKIAASGNASGEDESRVRLRHHDRITLSPATTLRFEAADGTSRLIRSILILAILAILVLAGGLMLWNPWAKTEPPANWNRAYEQLLTWAEQETRENRLPAETPNLMAEGWRLERAGDNRAASGKWWRLQMMLEDQRGTHQPFLQAAEEDLAKARKTGQPSALRRLVAPASDNIELSEQEMTAALAEFIRARFDWTAKNTPSAGPLQ